MPLWQHVPGGMFFKHMLKYSLSKPGGNWQVTKLFNWNELMNGLQFSVNENYYFVTEVSDYYFPLH